VFDSFYEVLLASWAFSLWAQSVVDVENDALFQNSLNSHHAIEHLSIEHDRTSTMCIDLTSIALFGKGIWSDDEYFNVCSFLNLQLKVCNLAHVDVLFKLVFKSCEGTCHLL